MARDVSEHVVAMTASVRATREKTERQMPSPPPSNPRPHALAEKTHPEREEHSKDKKTRRAVIVSPTSSPVHRSRCHRILLQGNPPPSSTHASEHAPHHAGWVQAVLYTIFFLVCFVSSVIRVFALVCCFSFFLGGGHCAHAGNKRERKRPHQSKQRRNRTSPPSPPFFPFFLSFKRDVMQGTPLPTHPSSFLNPS
jgi:hypothetical protein